MLALELAGVNIVLLHFAPQGGAADIEQLRHLLHPPAGHPGGVNNSFLFDGAKGQLAGSSDDALSPPGRSEKRYSGRLLRRMWPLSLLMAIFSMTLLSSKSFPGHE